MQMGTVKFEVSCIVDLDNKTMVTIAHDRVFDDVYMAVKLHDVSDLIQFIPDETGTLTEADIPSYILDEINEGE
jgi:hypothetical protein